MRRLSLVALLLAVALPAGAEIYTHTDENGVVHFTNVPPKGNRAKWKTVDLPTGKAGAERSGGGCPKCDATPARDRSPERFTRFDEYIREASELYQIPEALIHAIIRTESDYDPRVVSWAGAMGLMQLMPSNVKEDHVTDVFDPRDNILGGTRQLRVLANRYNGDIVLTLAAFSAGSGAVAKYGGVPPYEETQKYVPKVLKRYQQNLLKYPNTIGLTSAPRGG
jgi:soluble lytic murein transglycosylase-like protein